jgi:hypothetical protein
LIFGTFKFPVGTHKLSWLRLPFVTGMIFIALGMMLLFTIAVGA